MTKAKVQETSEAPVCVHRWRVEEPNGKWSGGTCGKCGASKAFLTAGRDAYESFLASTNGSPEFARERAERLKRAAKQADSPDDARAAASVQRRAAQVAEFEEKRQRAQERSKAVREARRAVSHPGEAPRSRKKKGPEMKVCIGCGVTFEAVDVRRQYCRTDAVNADCPQRRHRRSQQAVA